MWPFSRKQDDDKPDNRPPSRAAMAVIDSLKMEPARWVIAGPDLFYLRHDSQIAVDMEGWIRSPNLDDEPESNSDAVKEAIDDWIAARLKLPAPEPQKTLMGDAAT